MYHVTKKLVLSGASEVVVRKRQRWVVSATVGWAFCLATILITFALTERGTIFDGLNILFAMLSFAATLAVMYVLVVPRLFAQAELLVTAEASDALLNTELESAGEPPSATTPPRLLSSSTFGTSSIANDSDAGGGSGDVLVLVPATVVTDVDIALDSSDSDSTVDRCTDRESQINTVTFPANANKHTNDGMTLVDKSVLPFFWICPILGADQTLAHTQHLFKLVAGSNQTPTARIWQREPFCSRKPGGFTSSASKVTQA
jgi:hypothetical protein